MTEAVVPFPRVRAPLVKFERVLAARGPLSLHPLLPLLNEGLGANCSASSNSPRFDSRFSTEATENKNQEEIPQPPPGYVTIPVEMLEGLQQGNQYQQMPQNYNQPMNLQTQQQMEFNQPQMDVNPEEMEMQRQMEMQQEMEMQQKNRVPKLKHNRQIEDDDEEDEIAEQNLSKDEMESIQAQLSE